MSNPVDLMKRYNQAWSTKNADMLREVLASDCWLKGPGFDVKGIEPLIESMQQCNFTCSCENVRWCWSEDGCTVAQCYDWVITAPFKARIPVCEWVGLENGRIKSSSLYFDSALMPEEAAQAA